MINAHVPSKNQSKAATKREVKNNDSTTLKFILDGLPSSIKENVGEYTSARDLWLKLEKEYQNKRQDIEKISEEKPIEDKKHTPKYFQDIIFLFDRVLEVVTFNHWKATGNIIFYAPPHVYILNLDLQ